MTAESVDQNTGFKITQEFADKFAQEWIKQWNAHNLDAVLAHYSDAIEFASPFASKIVGKDVVVGKTALKDYWTRALQSYPDLQFELFHVVTSPVSLTIIYRSVKSLLAAETFLFDDDGKVVRVMAHYSAGPIAASLPIQPLAQ